MRYDVYDHDDSLEIVDSFGVIISLGPRLKHSRRTA